MKKKERQSEAIQMLIDALDVCNEEGISASEVRKVLRDCGWLEDNS